MTHSERPEWVDRFLTINETGEITGQDRSTVYRKINAGLLPEPVDIGGRQRIPGWKLWQKFGTGETEAS